MKYCDLHIHSTISDGTLTPEEIVDFAINKGLAAISITDHDSIDGIKPALIYSKDKRLEIVPGIELSVNYRHENNFDNSDSINLGSGADEIHLLCYFMDYESNILNELLSEIVNSRQTRAVRMIDNLKDVGINISIDEVKERAGNDVIGRPHLADSMIAHGYVANRNEAFKNYLIHGKPGYASRFKPEIKETIKILKSIGGVPILAHPGIIENQAIIGTLVELGVMGIEVYHSKHSREDNHKYIQIAEARNLLISGGSDCHGAMADFPPMIGNYTIEYKYLEKIKNASDELRKKRRS